MMLRLALPPRSTPLNRAEGVKVPDQFRGTSSEIDEEEQSTHSLQKQSVQISEVILTDDIEMQQLRELRGSSKRGF